MMSIKRLSEYRQSLVAFPSSAFFLGIVSDHFPSYTQPSLVDAAGVKANHGICIFAGGLANGNNKPSRSFAETGDRHPDGCPPIPTLRRL